MYKCSPKELESDLQSGKRLEYDIVFLADMPAFYRIALYNRLAQKYKILVIFLRGGKPTRNSDFHKGDCHFDCVRISTKSLLGQLLDLIGIWRKISYSRVVLFGWGEAASWLIGIISPKEKNCIVVESSNKESKALGLKGLMKRLLLKRISIAYCSGISHANLVRSLDFKGKIVITHGVGLYRRIKQPSYSPRKSLKNLIFVGRFVWQKNLEFLLKCMAKRPNIILHLVGFGPLESELKKIAPKNAVFYGAVENEKLSQVYAQMDAFVLPSRSETWGLVVEEALNNGLPILLSDRVGCIEDILEEGKNGFAFRFDDESDFLDKLDRIFDLNVNNAMREYISKRDSEGIENAQISAY